MCLCDRGLLAADRQQLYDFGQVEEALVDVLRFFVRVFAVVGGAQPLGAREVDEVLAGEPRVPAK